jgi:hypothetical protein
VTPKEVSEKLGALALLREKVLNLQVDLPQDLEKKLSELYPAIDKIKPNPPDLVSLVHCLFISFVENQTN